MQNKFLHTFTIANEVTLIIQTSSTHLKELSTFRPTKSNEHKHSNISSFMSPILRFKLKIQSNLYSNIAINFSYLT